MEAALSQSKGAYSATITWLPFLLRPDTPEEGREKPPNTPDNPRVGARLKQAGESVGINFTGKSDRAPNTIKSHILLEVARELELAQHVATGTQDKLAEVLFRMYFTDGVFLDDSALLEAAKEVGVPTDKAAEAMKDAQRRRGILQADQSVKQMGVHGVPYFIINGKPAFSGAQDPATFLEIFKNA